jgi:hypothetical protein
MFEYSAEFGLLYPIQYDRQMAREESQYSPPGVLAELGLATLHGLDTPARAERLMQWAETGALTPELLAHATELAHARFQAAVGPDASAMAKAIANTSTAPSTTRFGGGYWTYAAQPIPHLQASDADESGHTPYTYARAFALALTGVDDPDILERDGMLELLGSSDVYNLQSMRQYRRAQSDTGRALVDNIRYFLGAGASAHSLLPEYWSLCGPAVQNYGPLLRILSYLAVTIENANPRVFASYSEYLALYHGAEFAAAEGTSGTNSYWVRLYHAATELLALRKVHKGGRAVYYLSQPLGAEDKHILAEVRERTAQYLGALGPGCAAAARWVERPTPIQLPMSLAARDRALNEHRKMSYHSVIKQRTTLHELAAMAYTHQCITDHVPAENGYVLNDVSLNRWLATQSELDKRGLAAARSKAHGKLPDSAPRRTIGVALSPLGFRRMSGMTATQWVVDVSVKDADGFGDMHYLPEPKQYDPRGIQRQEAIAAWLQTPAGRKCAEAARYFGFATTEPTAEPTAEPT